MELSAFLQEVLHGFDGDPPDTDYQRGYRDAIEEMRRVAEREGWILPLISAAP